MEEELQRETPKSDNLTVEGGTGMQLSAGKKVSAASLILCILLLSSPALPSPDPRILRIVNEVNGRYGNDDTLNFEHFLSLLPVNEQDRRGYDEDGTAQKDLLKSRKIIRKALSDSLGQSRVSLQKFNADGYEGVNIIGTLPGCGPGRSRIYVLNAHYDSVQNAGADDNGSGVAGLLLLARTFSAHRFDATIVFIAFDQEEEQDRENGWGRGSRFYAEKARDEGKDIQAAVSIDAIGYNHNGNNIGSISRPDAKNGSPSAKLLSKVAQAFHEYTDLRMKVLTEEDGSDPYLFYKAGYPAVLVSEQFDNEGWPVNPYYHTEDDFFRSSSGVPQRCGGLRYIDPSYAESVLRGVAGWLATAAGVLDR